MKKTLFLVGIIVTGLVGGIVALQLDPVMDLGILRVIRNGTAQWLISGDSSDRLVINQTGSVVGAALTVDDANSATRVVSQPRLWFSTATASGAGYLAFNNTDNVLCMSTAAVQGSWVVVGSTAAASQMIAGDNGNFKKCYTP